MKKEVRKIDISSFLTPSYIYIPFDKEENISIPKNKYVYCNMNLSKIDKGLFSPVSGTIIGKNNMSFYNGETNSLVISNDYKDKKQKLNGGKTNITKYTKNEVIEILKTFNLYKETSNKKNILIYVNYDNFNLSNSLLVNDKFYDILETVDVISSIFNINKVTFILKNEDKISYEILSKYIGTFINFEIITTSKNINKIISKSNNSLIYSAFEIYEIYNALKYKNYTKEKYISINIKQNDIKVVYAKINISLEELLTVLRLKTISNNITVISSNNEIKITNREFIITKEIEAIILK